MFELYKEYKEGYMENEVLTEEQELEKVKQEIAVRKVQMANSAVLPKHDTDVMSFVKQEEGKLLETEEFSKISKKFGEERIKSDLSAEASRIRRKNIETAENEFENETRELRLKHLKAELEKEHAYNMKTLDDDAKHSQMLERRKKLVEKYGYLYDNKPENLIDVSDSKGKTYKAPKDFSYSNGINKIRQFGRNLSKLDRPILQTMKWILIIGAVVGGYFVLKGLGII